jgi:antitoxin (DNA-binding transcriptional repressor) of toxin-antitoxin stability system
MKPSGPNIGIAELKARCSEIVAKVKKTGVGRIVTIRGFPAAELRPLESTVVRRPQLGGMAGTVVVVGDIVNSHVDDVEYRDDKVREL